MAQCTANSKQSKTRCRNGSIPGGNVCRFHGGAAPNVKAAAKERLAALVDPAIETLGKLVRDKSPKIRLGAVNSVLDRNGHKGVEVYQELPYTPEDVERLESLSDEELALYVILRKKVTQAGNVA